MAIERDLNKTMENLYLKNKEKGKAHLASLFIGLGLSRATAYRKIKRLEEGSLKRAAGSGRRATIATQENVLKIAELFDKKSGISQRSVANMFNCHRTTINKILNQS